MSNGDCAWCGLALAASLLLLPVESLAPLPLLVLATTGAALVTEGGFRLARWWRNR